MGIISHIIKYFDVIKTVKSNISPEVIDIFKHILGDLYSGGLIFGGHFVLVSSYQDL